MDTGSSGSGDRGNTIARSSPAKNWCLVLNNYSDDETTQIVDFCRSKCGLGSMDPIIEKYIIAKEVGENGTPHLQGYIKLTVKKRIMSIFTFTKRIHWESCRGSEADNIRYCSKEGNIIAMQGIKLYEPIRTISVDMLYAWQRTLMDILSQPADDRTIHWFWSHGGNTGKTSFCKYLVVHLGAVLLDGKKADVLFNASNADSKIYLYDIERSLEHFVSYGSIEKIKNGMYATTKYESKMIVRNPPHVVCFANFAPEINRLSLDRWNIVNIDKGSSSELSTQVTLPYFM